MTMTDIGSDHDAAILLVVEEYRRLQSHDPKHEILQYLTKVEDNGFDYVSGEKYKEFLDKFETTEDKKFDHIKVAKVLVSYYIALRNAVDKIEGIDRSPKSKETNPTPVKVLEKDLDDLPF